MKFKVGEKVRVKHNLSEIKDFAGGYMSKMKEMEGKMVTIKREAHSGGVRIKECPNDYTYDVRAFEPIMTKEKLLAMPVGTKVTTDLEKDNIFIKYSKLTFSNEYGSYLFLDNDINDDFTINDKDCGTRIVKVEEPTYETVYDNTKEVKEMTVAEIEKALGYPVKIVKEDD